MILQQRKYIGEDVARMPDAHPLSRVRTPRLGVGVRAGARILLEVGEGSTFDSAGHLAPYAGIAPVIHPSGTSIRGEYPPDQVTAHSNAHCFSRRSLPWATSPAMYYDRKRVEGEKHNTALI